MTDSVQIANIVRRALEEDVGQGDVTSAWTLPPGLVGRGMFLSKAQGIIAGIEVAREVFLQVSTDVSLIALLSDGDTVAPGNLVAIVEGPMAAILTAERTALNFVQRMSGIASTARQYVGAVAGTKAVILDTRKTVPGLRLLDKWAVRLGGGQNHRMRLDDMVLIKDNHIAAAGNLTAALEGVSAHNVHQLPVEVEVKTWSELEEAVALLPDRIMLDNMSLAQMRRAVEYVAGRVRLEASGGITLENVREVAETGVDYISVGALTHSIAALDISLEIEQVDGDA
jgi:nicotinate-nucleotide pyrophosphorylase (carboxylating)